MHYMKRTAAIMIAVVALFISAVIQVQAIGIVDFRFATTAAVLKAEDSSVLATADSTSPAVITKEQAGQGIVIQDTISYMGLSNETVGYYLVTMTLNRIGFDGNTTEVHSEGPVRMTAPDMKEHEWVITMTLNDLEEGTYVVYERAEFHFNGTDEGNTEMDLSHADKEDKKQMIKVTADSRVSSVIHADNYAASADQPIVLTAEQAKTGVVIYDEIRIKGIDCSTITDIHAQLICINDNSVVLELNQSGVDPFNWEQGAGGWDIFKAHFYGRFGLKPGRTYVAVFSLYSGNTLIASHEDLDDPAEQIITEAEKVSVEFHKQSVGSSEELVGAGMKLVKGSDVNGTVLQEWVSEKTEKTFVLEPGTYVLVETSAPEGYLVSDPIVFRITEELTAEVKVKDEWVKQGSLSITMKDEKKPTVPAPTPTPKPTPTPSSTPKPEKPVNYVVPKTGVKSR